LPLLGVRQAVACLRRPPCVLDLRSALLTCHAWTSPCGVPATQRAHWNPAMSTQPPKPVRIGSSPVPVSVPELPLFV